MMEEKLQNTSRAVTHLVFRNGIVEKLHSEGKCLDDETEFEKMEKTLNFLAEFYEKDWDKAEKDPIFMD